MTKVSIIVATYRREYELRNALESLAEQTYKDIEIILVDDNGSREWNIKVKAVVDTFVLDNPAMNIKMIVNDTNQGSARARNIGINVANGKYITFLDDDDVYLPKKVQSQVSFMENGHYDYSITDLNLYNENNRLVEKRNRSYIRETTSEALCKYHLMYHLTGTDTLMFTKEYLKVIEGFGPVDVGDEYYLMHRAIEGGGKFGYLPECEVKAYIHTGKGGLSSGDGKIKGENELYEFKKSYFRTIDKKTKRYIRMRHYAVIAFAEMRRKQFLRFFVNAGMSFFSSPLQCLNLLRNRSC